MANGNSSIAASLSNVNIITGVGVYDAVYGTTRYTDITTAIAAGKHIICRRTVDSNVIMYDYAETSSNKYYFSQVVYDSGAVGAQVVSLNQSNVWAEEADYVTESTSNKVTSMSASSTDTQYPSAKAVYDSVKAVSDSILKFDTMPTASSDYSGKVVQYTGTSGSDYTKGYFYTCVAGTGETYSWSQLNVQPASADEIYVAEVEMSGLTVTGPTFAQVKAQYEAGKNIVCKVDNVEDVAAAIIPLVFAPISDDDEFQEFWFVLFGVSKVNERFHNLKLVLNSSGWTCESTSALESPESGSTGQFLQKTATSVQWATVQTESDIFYVNYEDGGSSNTSYDDILTAYNAGKELIFKYNKGNGYGIVYGNLVNYNSGAGLFIFEMTVGATGGNNANASIGTCFIYKTSSGTTSYSISQSTILKCVSSIPSSGYSGELILYTGTTTDTYEQGRTYKYDGFNTWSLVGEDYLTDNNVFILNCTMTNGTVTADSGTPLDDLDEAVSDGKAVVAKLKNSTDGQSVFLEMTYARNPNANDTTMLAYAFGGTTYLNTVSKYYSIILMLYADGTFSTTNAVELENATNKVTSWSSTTTDGHYPSEKLVKDSLDDKLDAPETEGTVGQVLKKSSTGTEWGDASSYTLPVADATTLGGIKSGTDITVDAAGNVSVNDDSHNHVISNVDGLQTALDAKLVAPETAGTEGQFLKKTSAGTQWADVPSSVSIGTATCTLTSAGWSSSSQTVSVTGVTASNIVVVSPAPASTIEFDTDKILLTAQAAGSLTFTCVTTPTVDITINVMIIEVGS